MHKKVIEETVDNTFNVLDEYKSLTVEQLQAQSASDRIHFKVCAVNVEGDLNIGMMARTSFLLGAETFYTFGRRKFDRRSLVGAQNYLDIQRIAGLDDNDQLSVEMFREFVTEQRLSPILVEQGGTPLDQLFWLDVYIDTNEYTTCFVFGNEASGFPESFLELPYPRISIPQHGVLRSYNVAAAASMVLWDFNKWHRAASASGEIGITSI